MLKRKVTFSIWIADLRWFDCGKGEKDRWTEFEGMDVFVELEIKVAPGWLSWLFAERKSESGG